MAESAYKEGYLTKQGHLWRNWRERWFVLDGHLLKYFKGGATSGEGSSRGSASKPKELGELKGVIALQNCTVAAVPPNECDGRQYCFKITPQSRKIYLINAGSAESRDEWMAAVVNNSKLSSSAILGQGGSTPGAGAGIDGRAEELNEEPEGSEVHNVAPSAGSDDSKLTLADFELLKVIGRGTYGKVMQVRRKDNGEIFAMKVLKKESIFARNDPKDLQHTIAERNVLALVNTAEHPFILGLKFAFHTPAKLYYVLNYCNGGDLYYLLSRCKRFKEGQARFYAAEVFLALRHLHSLGVIYRDLKPENVLLDADGHVKLTDFGLSKESPTADTFCGTPVYLAPEIWLRKTYGVEVDWWSLGCVLYEMVAGLPPFWGDTIKDVYKKVISTQPKFPPMTPECQSCIEKLLARESTQRLGRVENGHDIMTHEFFAGMSWDHILAKRIRPPFKSKSAQAEDTQNFHRAFTSQKPVDSLTEKSELSEEQEKHFEHFAYLPGMDDGGPLLPSVESRRSTENWEDAASTRATEDAEAVAGLSQLRLPSSELASSSERDLASATKSVTDHAFGAATACESAGASAEPSAGSSVDPSGGGARALPAAEVEPPGGADGGAAGETGKASCAGSSGEAAGAAVVSPALPSAKVHAGSGAEAEAESDAAAEPSVVPVS